MTETIVMIHGMWGTGWYWENFKRFFEGEGYHCVVPTLRFHDMDPKGLPDPRLGTTSLLDYAADLQNGRLSRRNTRPYVKDINKYLTKLLVLGRPSSRVC